MKEDLNKLVSEGAVKLMYFEDGSVVQRLPLELTAAGHGANCEAINSRLLDCVNGRIEPRLCTMRSCVPNI